MTQGLQFSVLFSSAESTLSLDAMPANAGQQSPELEQQAARFRQLLDTEQTDGQRRQLVAAPQSKADATVINQTQPVVINTQQQSADNSVLPEAVNAQQALDTELNNVAAEDDAAGELLGLIQRANLTSGQLQKKAAVSAEFQQLVPELPIDKAGPVEQELAGIDLVPVTQTDKDLTATPYGREGAGTLQPVSLTPVAPEQSITPVPVPELVTDTTIIDKAGASASSAERGAKAQLQPIALPDTAVPEQGLTPVPEVGDRSISASRDIAAQQPQTLAAQSVSNSEKLSSSQSAPAAAQPDTVKSQLSGSDSIEAAEQKLPTTDASLSSAKSDALQAAANNEIVGSVIGQTTKPDNQRLVEAAGVQPEVNLKPVSNDNLAAASPDASVAATPMMVSGNAIPQPAVTADPTADRQPITIDSVQHSEKIPATNAVSSQPVSIDATVTPVVAQALVDDSELAQPQSGKVVEQKESSVTSLTSGNREIAANSSSEKERRLTEPVTAAQTAVQSDAVARSAPNLADNSLTNQENKASRQISAQLSNGVGSIDNLKSETSPGENAEQRGAGQGNEQRSFQPARLDVLLANTATGQSSAQAESFQQQLARFDAAVASSAQLQRTTEKATTPELSARLKQLNLQQQDAAGQLRERVQLMVRQNIQVAEIRLDPAELGQMQIRINLQQEQASVQFIVQQQQAKELLEQQMPRLREMLQQQGIQLGEGQVQQQARQQSGQGEAGQRQPAAANSSTEPATDDLPEMKTLEVRQRERLVDYYA